MSANDTLSIITSAEARAAGIRRGAEEAARSLVSEAGADSEKRISEASARLLASKRDALGKIEEEAESRIREECLDADFEGQKLTNRATKHMSAAVRYICREIIAKCQ
ncbi:MAG: hypothetical protein ILO42_02325 [Clostridia bacterium]|nr:hypothetical protein [Clostridia bacterium]